MTNHDINEALTVLGATTDLLEDAFIESEGECTEETDALERQKAALETLLKEEGIDALGRWLKGKEDEKRTIQDEKKVLDKKVKSIDNTIAYIKSQIRRIMDATGETKAKGLCYSFTAATSSTVTADAALIKERYGDRADFALRAAGIPEYIGFTLKGLSSAVPEGEDLPDVFTRETEETVRFTKPRKAKEEE